MALTAFLLWGCGGGSEINIGLGASTSVHDSGLLDVLAAEFEAANPSIRLRPVAAGSGELLEMGARGDLDVLISHSPQAELEFMDAGFGSLRRRLMWNDFIIVGPASDPIGIRGATDPARALADIASSHGSFLSRADSSGTHLKELELWQAAGVTDRGRGYREMGTGMANVLIAAAEVDGYALTDRGTFSSLGSDLGLTILVAGDDRLMNVYHVILVAEAREPAAARRVADWLTSAAGLRVIGSFGVQRFGEPLFHPFEEPG